MFARAFLLLAIAMGSAGSQAQTTPAPLVLEAKIPLGEVRGRIDHFSIDVKRQRLFVTELGNDSLGVIDLEAGKVLRAITGFSEPQGVAYVPFGDAVYVANAGDGSVRILRGEDFAPTGRIELGNDADNVRVDTPRKRVLVGYGKGALAVIDPASQTTVADIRLKAHPEGFQIDEAGAQVYVNVPDAREIQVVDLATAATRSLPMENLRGNFPMAIDRDARRVLTVFRNPPTLVALASQGGRIAAKIDTCGDADDVFVDPTRHRVYVSCGEGAVDVFEPRGDTYVRLAKVATAAGARTSLYVPELDQLFVAVRAASGEPAAIWVFRPIP
jgi:DNA-binding beta-propeller fold protein YncE